MTLCLVAPRDSAAADGTPGSVLRCDDSARDRGADGCRCKSCADVFAIDARLFHFEVVALGVVFLAADLAGRIARIEAGDLIGIRVCASAQGED